VISGGKKRKAASFSPTLFDKQDDCSDCIAVRYSKGHYSVKRFKHAVEVRMKNIRNILVWTLAFGLFGLLLWAARLSGNPWMDAPEKNIALFGLIGGITGCVLASSPSATK
jgi:TRAP-type C4-dicarboxylate transport system permease small subunit